MVLPHVYKPLLSLSYSDAANIPLLSDDEGLREDLWSRRSAGDLAYLWFRAKNAAKPTRCTGTETVRKCEQDNLSTMRMRRVRDLAWQLGVC